MKSLKSAWNLRTKTIIVIGLVLVAMIAVLYLATTRILLSSFVTVEKTTTERDVSRITDAIKDEMEALASYTSAYSKWDDSIDFVQRGTGRSFAANSKDEYVESNVVAATFEAEGHNLFLYFNKRGKLIWGASYDLRKAAFRDLTKSLLDNFKSGGELLTHNDPDDLKNGFIFVDGYLMYISSQPLVNTNNEPPIEGTLATGRDFDQARIKAVEDKTHLDFSIYRLDSDDLPADVAEAKAKLTNGQSIVTEPQNQNIVHGYTIVKDVYDQPLLILRAEVPREVYKQGLAARDYVAISLVAIGIVFLIMTVVLLTRIYRRDQEIQELKDRFIAIASHELRTPLTSIKGGADLLAMQKLPASGASSIRLIREGITRLTQLTNELINIVTLEKGHFKAEREQLDAALVLTQVCDTFKHTAEAKGLKLNCKTAPDLPAIMADDRLLRSAVMNLLDNAIKFTDKGSVSLSASVAGDDMVIEVTDTGPGISEANTHMLFQKFSKIASVRESFKEGHGLGLYLTKLAIEAHQGKIDVKSTPKGSTFSIVLPLSKS